MFHTGSGFDEPAAPQFYRKIGLNGRFLADKEPYLHKRTDVEPEKTCIDALTLQLRYQTSDVYVSLVSTDFALEVRRDYFSSAWCDGHGLSAGQRPDLPFGNCWLSGLAANVHVIDSGPDRPVYVLVSDEQGTVHRFVEFFKDGLHAGYYPLPGGRHQQDSRAMSLTRHGDQWEFRRKYGTTLQFDCKSPAVQLSTAAGASTELHLYYRAVRASDRRGGYLAYHFNDDNPGLIADGISFAGRTMAIHRNSQGVVEKIVDLRGNEHRYEYRASSVPGGAPLLVRRLFPPHRGRNAVTTYEYEEVGGGAGEQHAAISLIADPLGNIHRFTYRHQFAGAKSDGRQEWSLARQPVCISEVHLPDNKSITKFYDYSPPAEADVATFVCDAEKNGQLYEFTGRETVTLDQLPWRRGRDSDGDPSNTPRFTAWTRQQVTYYQGSRHRFDGKTGRFRPGFFTKCLLKERYEFDIGAGMALVRAIDAAGNVTTFGYQDRLVRPQLDAALPCGFEDPFSRWSKDVTDAVNPRGGKKRFTYHPANRAIIREEEELGCITVYGVDETTGLVLSKIVYADARAEVADARFTFAEFEYGNREFPGFLTKKAIRKTKAFAESPEWEVDLVRVYEADDHGNRVKEIADPDGRKFTWISRFNEHNAIVSKLYPDGYYIQYRYDPFNRLDRTYRARGSVKKAYFDARGNKLKEIEPNGNVEILEYANLNRIIKKTAESGPADKREKVVTVYRYNAMGSKTYEAVVGKPPQILRHDGLQRVIFNKTSGKPSNTYSYSASGCSNLFESGRFCASSILVGRSTRWHYQYDALQNNTRKWRSLFRFFGLLRLHRQLVVQTFDAAGNMIQKTDQNGSIHYEYDALNRLVAEDHFLPGGRKILYTLRTLRTSTGLEYGSVDRSGKRTEKRFDTAGDEITSK